ncbi:MAG: helix-hairpin-helix domain-containing protein [FCB group bacterium]|nr:helix-hairpin-helix domain-containing protein [FCB group bacterium]
MNRFFDFTKRQLKFLGFLSALAIFMGVFLFIRANVFPAKDDPPFQVFIGENEQKFTGIFVVDPNTSPADSLELLPGIGKVLADRIIEYRQRHHFVKEVDITEVRGIGPKLYERIKPYLKIRN